MFDSKISMGSVSYVAWMEIKINIYDVVHLVTLLVLTFMDFDIGFHLSFTIGA